MESIREEEIEKILEVYLTPKEAMMFKMYHSLGEYTQKYTLNDIGKATGHTRERVRQIINGSKKILARHLLSEYSEHQK
ncbi:hypothetical protein A3F64_01905 [Candidatus Saccharibacteria bacterium RIFCSPHIGHO2_12_FULL_42_8]|nr:MAG: hypothetical protein A3F64_01905 [Candidatus Saccharibacteria bacterium RIFCSPHIGHO2_12_FULL_42_8]